MQRIRLSLYFATVVFLVACAENPNTPSTAHSSPANPVILGSASTAPGPGGVAQQVALLEQDIVDLGNLLGAPLPPQRRNNGIPHRIEAAGAQIQVIQGVMVERVNAAIAAGTFSAAIAASTFSAASGGSTFSAEYLFALLAEGGPAKTKLESIQARAEAISIGDMFAMQMLMNHLGEMSEMSTAVVNALNAAIEEWARDPKGA